MTVEKTTRLFDDRLRFLLKSSAEIFAGKGYEGTAIRDLARRAGLGLSNVYYYVSCKEELLYLIQRDTFDSLLREAERGIAGVEDPQERLRIVVRNHVAHFTANMPELTVCARELRTLSGAYYEEVRKIRRDYFDLVRGTVRDLVARFRSPLDPWPTTAHSFGMPNWVSPWYGRRAARVEVRSTVLVGMARTASVPSAGAGEMPAAVDAERFTRDPGAVVGGQEDNGGGDVRSGTHTPQRVRALAVLEEAGVGVLVIARATAAASTQATKISPSSRVSMVIASPTGNSRLLRARPRPVRAIGKRRRGDSIPAMLVGTMPAGVMKIAAKIRERRLCPGD